MQVGKIEIESQEGGVVLVNCSLEKVFDKESV